jgi:hypothetical protein
MGAILNFLGRQATCPVCRERRNRKDASHQVYYIQSETGQYVFDIEKAIALCGDGRPAQEVPREAVVRMLGVNEYAEQHLDHVNPEHPGIVGQMFGAISLFDGTHRAARCLRDNLPFTVYMLSYEESQACLLSHESVGVGAEQFASELRGVLRNNPQADKVELELDCDTAEGEDAVRALLTEEENKRVIFKFKIDGQKFA